MSGALDNNAGPVPGWNAQSSTGGNQSLVKGAGAMPVLLAANNLDDVASEATSRANLGVSNGTGGPFMPLAGGTFTAGVAPAVVGLTFATTVAVNAAAGNVFGLTLTASTATLGIPTNPVDGQTIRLRVTQGGSGSYTLAYNAIWDFGTSGSPTLSTAVGKVDLLSFEYSAALTKWIYAGSELGN